MSRGTQLTEYRFLSTGHHSDYTIICKDEDTGEEKEFHVHKMIIHACCPVLRNNLGGSFKFVALLITIVTYRNNECYKARENTGVLNVQNLITAFEALIYQMYNNKYIDSLAGADTAMAFAVKAYAVAEMTLIFKDVRHGHVN